MSADPTEALWSALTSRRCRELVHIMRSIDERAAVLRDQREHQADADAHAYALLMVSPADLIRNRDEIRERFSLEFPEERRRARSLDEQMGDDVGIPCRGEI